MFEAAETGNSVDKKEYEAQEPDLRVDLINAQYDLKDADFPVVLLLMGDDRQGVNDVLQLLHEWMDARYLRSHFFGALTLEEQERPRFWRYWRALPRRGALGIFMGAWALNAIADRARDRLDDGGFERRLEHIQRFEQALVDDGVLLLKFWLHLPKKEMKRRLKRAKKDPEKAWRVDETDWLVYDNWDLVMPLAQHLIRRTGTVAAPWDIVESSDLRYRNLAVARTLLQRLTQRLGGERTASPASASGGIEIPQVDGERGVLDVLDLSRALSRDAYKKRLEAAQGRLRRRWTKAREANLSAVLLFEGWDAAGKGGVIRRLTRALNVRDYTVLPVGAPSEEEAAHHYLWRFWRHLPRRGRILVFDRSWYGRVLVERVEGLTPEADWQRAYREINDFEEQIVEHGVVLLKFWLHIDQEEQLRRFEAREETPYKKYKISEDDYRNRGKWDDYLAAVGDMVSRTSTEIAPWHLVPANDKRWARVQVLETVCDAVHRALRSG